MSVAAGSSVTFKAGQAVFHPGPIQFYMAKSVLRSHLTKAKSSSLTVSGFPLVKQRPPGTAPAKYGSKFMPSKQEPAVAGSPGLPLTKPLSP